MKVDLIILTGTHYDIGVQHGRRLSEIINKSVIPFVLDDMQDKGISADDYRKITKKYADLIGERFPEVIDETRGIAEGAEIDYEIALLLLFYWEVRDTIEHSIHECSSFVAAGDATTEGQPIATQNSDWPLTMSGKGIGQAFHVTPKGKYKFIGRGLAGNLGRTSVIGFNEKGLCFVGSGIHQVEGAGFGFPALIATRIGLERCTTVEEFINLVKSIPRWSHAGENVDVVDMDGSMARISFSTRRTMIVQTKDHYIASTNHYHNKEMRQFGPPGESAYPSSYARYGRLIELLRTNYGEIDREKAMEIMSDHHYSDNPPEGGKSICRHGANRETMTNLISVPSKGEFWISEGTPCRRKYSKFNI